MRLAPRVYDEDHPWRRAPRWYLPVVAVVLFGLVLAGVLTLTGVLVPPALAEVSAVVVPLAVGALLGFLVLKAPAREPTNLRCAGAVIMFVVVASTGLVALS